MEYDARNYYKIIEKFSRSQRLRGYGSRFQRQVLSKMQFKFWFGQHHPALDGETCYTPPQSPMKPQRTRRSAAKSSPTIFFSAAVQTVGVPAPSHRHGPANAAMSSTRSDQITIRAARAKARRSAPRTAWWRSGSSCGLRFFKKKPAPAAFRLRAARITAS